MSSLSYLGLKLAPIWTVLVGSSALIWMTLASSIALKAPDMEGMAGLAKESGALRHSSFSSAAATMAMTSSMQFCSHYNARWALVSMMMMPVGFSILS
jgi:hypothetical protein